MSNIFAEPRPLPPAGAPGMTDGGGMYNPPGIGFATPVPAGAYPPPGGYPGQTDGPGMAPHGFGPGGGVTPLGSGYHRQPIGSPLIQAGQLYAQGHHAEAIDQWMARHPGASAGHATGIPNFVRAALKANRMQASRLSAQHAAQLALAAHAGQAVY